MDFRSVILPSQSTDLIREVQTHFASDQFVLVGWTALSMHTGQDMTDNIDLQSNQSVDFDRVALVMDQHFKADKLYPGEAGLHLRLRNSKLAISSHPYPWLGPTTHLDGVAIASLADIAAISVHQATQFGYRIGDFMNIHLLLERMPFNDLLTYYQERYSQPNAYMARHNLHHHPKLLLSSDAYLPQLGISWGQADARIKDAIHRPDHVFRHEKKEEIGLAESVSPQRKKYRRPS